MILLSIKWSLYHTFMLARFVFNPSQLEIQDIMLLQNLNCKMLNTKSLFEPRQPASFQLQELSLNPQMMISKVMTIRSNS